jgi:hypothetical protein
MVTYFRYDMLGKSPETILAEQASQKAQIQDIIQFHLPQSGGMAHGGSARTGIDPRPSTVSVGKSGGKASRI